MSTALGCGAIKSKGLTNRTNVVFFKKINLAGGYDHELKCSGGD